MFREKCTIIENKMVAPGHYILRLASPRISKNAKPGQFIQVLCADPSTSSGLSSTDPLLPRPFSFLTASKKDFSILYQVVGNGTKILSQAARNDSLWILGPLGNGFTLDNKSKVKSQKSKQGQSFTLVGGGVGIPPLYHLTQQLLRSKVSKNDIHVFLGARNRSLLLCEKDFKKLGVDLKVATDDGSKGRNGFVTEMLEEFLKSRQKTADRIQEKQNSPLSTDYCLPSTQIFTCGPTPMLKAVSTLSKKYKVPCEVSVEVPMACGFGACLGCAIKVKNQVDSRKKTEDRKSLSSSTVYSLQSTDYRFAIACTEGPVFQAGDIVWE